VGALQLDGQAGRLGPVRPRASSVTATLLLPVRFRPRSAGGRYVLRVTGSDVHGNRLTESRTLVATR